jgi:hypothetical protein
MTIKPNVATWYIFLGKGNERFDVTYLELLKELHDNFKPEFAFQQ